MACLNDVAANRFVCVRVCNQLSYALYERCAVLCCAVFCNFPFPPRTLSNGIILFYYRSTEAEKIDSNNNHMHTSHPIDHCLINGPNEMNWRVIHARCFHVIDGLFFELSDYSCTVLFFLCSAAVVAACWGGCVKFSHLIFTLEEFFCCIRSQTNYQVHINLFV